MMVGSGIKGQGGAVLVYRSKQIDKGEHSLTGQDSFLMLTAAWSVDCCFLRLDKRKDAVR